MGLRNEDWNGNYFFCTEEDDGPVLLEMLSSDTVRTVQLVAAGTDDLKLFAAALSSTC